MPVLNFWSLRAVNIIDIHSAREYSQIIVDHLPFTDKEKIEWWLKNQQEIMKKYNIPHSYKDGSYNITIWNIGDGYLNSDEYYRKDLLCFSDMKDKRNCIEKKLLLTIEKSANNKIYFSIGYSGNIYTFENNKIILYRQLE
ncbi:DUF943 family protein [Pantoea sp. B65]|uniref:DUF943 family protein n=1 Tax=Pantoea sp. B65 TaxID=2813359 RepID=UPI0039B39166